MFSTAFHTLCRHELNGLPAMSILSLSYFMSLVLYGYSEPALLLMKSFNSDHAYYMHLGIL